VTRVRRQLVGGPADGRIVEVKQGGSYHLPGPYAIVSIDTGNATFEQFIHDGTTPYTQATAPTGERVLLAPGTCWPDRFDTEAWCHRRSPGRAAWRRLGPWLWRGDGVDPARPADARRGWMLQDTATYLLAVVERPGEFGTLHTEAPLELVDERELTLQALAGHGTAEDSFVHQLQAEKRWVLTPPCPADECDGKATVTLRARGTVVEPRFKVGGTFMQVLGGQEVAMCPEHASEERRRFDIQWGGVWDLDLKAS
jgi:hypothetical protein